MSDDITRERRHAPRRFPFPFDDDAWRGPVFMPFARPPAATESRYPLDVDSGYSSDCDARRAALDEDPSLFQALPQALPAQWDTLELIMESLARDYPDHFALSRSGARWIWENRPLNLLQVFTFGDAATLPYEPLEYAARQAPGDWLIVAPRDGALWIDAALATADAALACDIDVGIDFGAWQRQTYSAADTHALALAEQRLREHVVPMPLRRFDWSIALAAPGAISHNATEPALADSGDVVARSRLCVRTQTLWRLPRSQAFALCGRRYELSFAELANEPQWAKRLQDALSSLPPPLAERVGAAGKCGALIAWLARIHDPTSGGSKSLR